MVASAWNFFSTYRTVLMCGTLFYFAGVALLYQQLPERAQHFDVDSGSYHAIALRKIETGVFEKNDKPLLHPLGYSACLVALYSVVGDSVGWVVAIQALLAFLSVIAIMLIAYRWYGQKPAVYAFFLALTNVGFYIFPQVLLVEVIQLFLIAWAWERFVSFLQTNSKRIIAVSGLLAGLSLLFKPSALHFPLLVVMFLLFFAHNKKEFLKKYAASIVIFMAAFYASVIAIMLRNWVLWGYFKFSYLVEENLFWYFHQQLLVALYGYIDTVAWAYLGSMVDRAYSFFDAGYWQECRHAFMHIIFTRWDQVFLVCIQNSIKNCLGLYTRNLAALVDPSLQMQLVSFFKNTPTLTSVKQYVVTGSPFVAALGLYEVFYSGMRWSLLGVGFYSNKRDAVYWLTLLSGFYFLGVLCMYGNGRYRFVQEPLMIVFAAQALSVLVASVPHLLLCFFKKRKIA